MSSKVNYVDVAGGDTFLARWLEFMNAQETPRAYDFFSGLWLLSNALGRGVVVDRPRAPVFLNIYCILVAESGITRKSTAVRAATAVLREAAKEFKHPLFLVERKTTPSQLEWKLHERSQKDGSVHLCLSISELAAALGRGAGVHGMPVLLTDLYDCPAQQLGGGSAARGTVEFRNVYATFLSASTPAWLARAVNPDVVEGGFTSRCLFVVSERRKRLLPWPEQSHVSTRELAGRLVDIHNLASERPTIAISRGGRVVYENWYTTRPKHRDPFRSSFQSREDAHILRVAGLLCINRGAWEIQQQDVLNAIKIITEVREDGASLFEGTSAAVPLTVRAVDRVRDVLRNSGNTGIKQYELATATRHLVSADTLRGVLAVMHELDMVQKFDVPSVDGRKGYTLWRGTAKLYSKTLGELLLLRVDPSTISASDEGSQIESPDDQE